MKTKTFLTLLQHLKTFVRDKVLKRHEILKDGTCIIVSIFLFNALAFILKQNTGVIIKLYYLLNKSNILKDSFLMWYTIQTVHFSRQCSILIITRLWNIQGTALGVLNARHVF